MTEVNYIGGRQTDWEAIEKGAQYSIDDDIIKYWFQNYRIKSQTTEQRAVNRLKGRFASI